MNFKKDLNEWEDISCSRAIMLTDDITQAESTRDHRYTTQNPDDFLAVSKLTPKFVWEIKLTQIASKQS